MNIKLFDIFKIFFIIGLQLLGGGYVIVPLLKKYLVDERKWLNEEELYDYFAMSQCIPGIIAGNISISCGYKLKKLSGALAAIAGIILPSFISIIILANILKGVVDIEFVQNAFWGIRISVVVLIIITVRDMWKKSVNSLFSYILFLAALILLLTVTVSPSIIIIASAIIALLFSKGEVKNND